MHIYKYYIIYTLYTPSLSIIFYISYRSYILYTHLFKYILFIHVVTFSHQAVCQIRGPLGSNFFKFPWASLTSPNSWRWQRLHRRLLATHPKRAEAGEVNMTMWWGYTGKDTYVLKKHVQIYATHTQMHIDYWCIHACAYICFQLCTCRHVHLIVDCIHAFNHSIMGVCNQPFLHSSCQFFLSCYWLICSLDSSTVFSYSSFDLLKLLSYSHSIPQPISIV